MGYVCKSCGAKFEGLENYTEYLSSKHSVKCSYCGSVYEMSELSFVDGLKDILNDINKKQENGEYISDTDKISSLSISVNIYLHSGEWAKATEFADRIIAIDPSNAFAYLAKLLAEYRFSAKEQLVNAGESFADNINYLNLVKFASPELVNEINGYLKIVITDIYYHERNEIVMQERAEKEKRFEERQYWLKQVIKVIGLLILLAAFLSPIFM